jgi:hypothetical protein
MLTVDLKRQRRRTPHLPSAMPIASCQIVVAIESAVAGEMFSFRARPVVGGAELMG